MRNIHHSSNARPDYQELLTNVEFVVWVSEGIDKATSTLPERLQQAFIDPASINRFGGLCLGESRDLVNAVTPLRENHTGESLWWLIRDEDGWLTLPYWVDHVGSQGTRWQRYVLQESQVWQPSELAWIVIQAA
jgi:CRISPR-associated protein Cas5t